MIWPVKMEKERQKITIALSDLRSAALTANRTGM